MNNTPMIGSFVSRKRLRSPSYPNIGLPEALAMMRRIYDVAFTNPIPEEEMARQLGYESASSWLGLRLSAMSKFGLLENIPASPTRGKCCMITALGEAVLRNSPESPEHISALRQAALRPTIYDDLWNRFGPDLPINSEMAAYLVDERKFNPKAVATLLTNFRATAECADLKSMPRPKREMDGETIAAFANMRFSGRTNVRTTPSLTLGQPYSGGMTIDEMRKQLEQHFAETSGRIASIPLADGETATITMPKKMSPQSWQMLIDTLELWKKQAGAADVF
jgi:hypothetical protein